MKCTLVTFGLLLIAMASPVAAQPPRPNILFFYVDDMGWGSIGPNGQAARKTKNLPYVRTPNLDRLAAEGVNFTRGYGCTVCSPARSSLQTGFHQGHTFADRNDPNNAKKAIRADDPSIGKALSAAGYVTGYWGKWGYGGSKDQAKPIIENVQTLPTSHGYQYVLAELHHVRAHTFFQPKLWNAPTAANTVGVLELIPNSMARYQGDNSWPATPAQQNHPEYPKTAYCDDAYSFAALDFVRQQGQNYNKTGQPFHGLLAVQIPHAPFGEITRLPEWDHAYRDDPHYKSLSDQARQWASMVTRIDAHFGNILNALDDPNNDGDTSDSISDNTLVIFQSDNGGPGGKSHDELDTNGGLSGTKGKIQEGGIRVPLIMRWPARITSESKLKAGTNCDMVVDVTDLLPTFCELAGAPIPLGIDGVSIAPTLLGRGQQRRREFIIHEAGNGQSIIRGNHKLVRSNKRAQPLKLYDLTTDPAEKKDIAENHPGLTKELETLLLGERVAEPKGFANTYHRWTGKSGASMSDADHWSDYKYSNAGVTYMDESGAPQLSWVATVENSEKKANFAYSKSDLNFLALEVRGNANGNATQSLILDRGVNLTGRNEIRLGSHAHLTLNHGTVSSLRWIDIQPGATLDGHGKLNAVIYNDGTIANTGSEHSVLEINGDYHQMANGTLRLTLTRTNKPVIEIAGKAHLGGELQVDFPEGFDPKSGSSLPIISANVISGRFSNTDNEVVTSNGRQLQISYSKSSVSLIVK